MLRRSALAYVNEHRDWRIYAALVQQLIVRARRLYADEPLAMDLVATVYALDSTTVDLCLSLFRWAPFRRTKSAIKLHTLLDLRGSLQAFIHISDGKLHDVHALDQMPIEAGAFFVIRAKRSLRYTRVHSLPVEKSSGVRSDQIVELAIPLSRQGNPERLRRIRFFDEETRRFFVYLTNNFALPALTIARLYKSRWQVELFLNRVTICVYAQVAILKMQLDLPQSLHKILWILDAHAFEKLFPAESFMNFAPQN